VRGHLLNFATPRFLHNEGVPSVSCVHKTLQLNALLIPRDLLSPLPRPGTFAYSCRMQQLSRTTTACATALLDTVPGLLWYVRRHMRRHRKGLSVPQFRALVQIQSNPQISLSCVAEHLGASLPTTSRLIGNLVSKGFLSRSESPSDRRQVVLVLTPRGKAIIDAARAASIAQMEKEFAPLPAQDRETVCRAMTVLADFVDNARATKAADAAAVAPAPLAQRPRARSRRTPLTAIRG
jgi:DNA-binding MarR family transcriptional regulator